MTHEHLRSSSPRSINPGLATRVALGLAAALWLVVLPAGAQAGVVRIRKPAARVIPACGGSQLDGVCGMSAAGAQCAADPLAESFDADCFPFEALVSPEPAPACAVKGAPCEIHEAINRMGAMYESGIYDPRVMLEVLLGYWDDRYWDLDARWGAHGLDGYVVYAVVRNALRFHEELRESPFTVRVLEQTLRDHADRGLPTTVDNGERWFHEGEKLWNSWSEDYVAFALGYAAADAWFASPWREGASFGEYRDRVTAAIDLAFSISHARPQTLRFEPDADPTLPADQSVVMLRNHGEYSPVYAMAIIARVWDINTVYRAALLPDVYSSANVPDNLIALYTWMTSKIEPNPDGAGYRFRTDGCLRRDGVLSHCDDRNGDPVGSPGHQREPAHYPLDSIMPQFGVTEDVGFFGPSCEVIGPAGTRQKPFNHYFNCAFQDAEGFQGWDDD